MHIPCFPSAPSFEAVVSDVHILLFLSAIIIVLAFIQLFAKFSAARSHDNKSKTGPTQPNATLTSEKSREASTRVWAWANGFSMKFESLPIALEPHSFARGPPVVGAGIGVIKNSTKAAKLTSLQTMSQNRCQGELPLIQPRLAKSWYLQQQAKLMRNPSRNGPSFEQPVSTVYRSELPVSMAKMIMSRHTHRRPSQGSARRSVSSPPSRRREALSSDVVLQDNSSDSESEPSEAKPPSSMV